MRKEQRRYQRQKLRPLCQMYVRMWFHYVCVTHA